MGRKTVRFSGDGILKLPNDKPVVYKILTPGGKNNYTGIAKKGRVRERLQEHLDDSSIPGAKVQVEQKSSIDDAAKSEGLIIARTKPKYNERGK